MEGTAPWERQEPLTPKKGVGGEAPALIAAEVGRDRSQPPFSASGADGRGASSKEEEEEEEEGCQRFPAGCRLTDCLPTAGFAVAQKVPSKDPMYGNVAFQKVPFQSQQIQSYTNLYKPIQTYTNVYKPIQTYTNLYKPIQTYTNLFCFLGARRG